VITNSGWLFTDRVIRLGVGLVVGIWVARYLGKVQFGLLNYSIALVAILSPLATLGLDGIVVRELLRFPDKRDEILGSAFALKVCGGILIVIATVVVVQLLHPGDLLMMGLTLLVAGGLLVQAFDVIDFWFQSRVQSKYTVLSKNTAFLVASIFKVYLIVTGAQLIWFAWAGLLEIVIGAIGLNVAYRQNAFSIARWKPQLERCRGILHDSWPLTLSSISIIIYMKIGTVMLGNMVDSAAVGIYSGATRISEVWYFIPSVIVSSVFPAIVRAKAEDEGLYYRRMQKLFSMMTALSLSIAVPMTFLSGLVVKILLGPGYLGSGPILAVHIWAAVFVFLGVAQGPWDLTENLTRLALFRTVSGMLVNLALNWLLIPRYGAIGAAVASVASYACSAFLLNLVARRTRRIFLCQLRAFLFFRYLRMT